MTMNARKAASYFLWANDLACLAALGLYMLAFGILTGSVTAGLMFPLALPSMAFEGDLVGIWICLSTLVTLAWIVDGYLKKRVSPSASAG